MFFSPLPCRPWHTSKRPTSFLLLLQNVLPDRWKYKVWASPRIPQNAGEGYFGWAPKKGAAKDAPFKAFEYPGGLKEMKLEYQDKISYLKAKRPDKVSFQVCFQHWLHGPRC